MTDEPVRFADFELDRAAYELRRDGVAVRLQRIPLELLFLLVEKRGRVVTRDEIMDHVWGKGIFIDSENGINTAVRKIRRALDDNPEAPQFVATVPTRGYRFIAQLVEPAPAGPLPKRIRAATPMVGRGSELSALLSGLDDVAQGRGRLFLISGEPGVGKSRLAEEAVAFGAGRGMPSFAGHCSENEEAVAYLAFVEILENFIERTPGPDRIRSALGADAPELARLLPSLRTLIPDLAPPLDLSPAQARRHLFNSFLNFAVRAAAGNGALMVLEDLQWADDSTLSLLDYLAQHLSDAPLMIIGTYRDDALKHGQAFTASLELLIRRRIAERISLKRLSRKEVAAMIDGLSGKPSPPEIFGPIFGETEGNPFFVEELFRHLEEENRLFDSAGRFRTDLRIGEDEAPPSVRLVVDRRLARLSDGARQMLARAAIIGRVFDFALLCSASGRDADSMLEEIEEAEWAGLIGPEPGTASVRYHFSHELSRQVVIADLSAVRRQRLHLEVVTAMERSSRGPADSSAAGGPDNRAADFANRYARGGDPIKAIQFCARAVLHLANVGSITEGLAQFQNGLELLQQIPDESVRSKLELRIRIASSGLLGDSKGYASVEAERSLVRAMELGQRPGVYWKRTWLALYGALFVYLTRPDVPKACEIAGRLVALAQRQNSIDHMADANTYLACAKMYSGDFNDADRLFERGWSMLKSSANPSDSATAREIGRMVQDRTLLWQEGTPQNNRALSALNLWFLGYPARAIERIAVATDIAHTGIKTMLADIHGFATYLYELLREPDSMRLRAQARLELSEDAGYAAGRALSEFYLAYADTFGVDPEGGLTRMKDHMAQLRATGFEIGAGHYLALIASGLGKVGRFNEAMRTIDEALTIIERSGQRHYEAEVHRIKGELLLEHDRADAAQAEQSFRSAIEVARRQSAKSWELRATTSLARLLGRTRRRAEARSALAQVYESFTEGFDTADLRDARALLEKFGG